MRQWDDGRGNDSWASDLAPLGIPTLVIANDPSLLRAAVAPYAVWKTDPPADPPKITLRLERRMTPAARVGFRIAVEGSRLRMTGDGIAGQADAKRGWAECGVGSGIEAGDLAEAIETLLLFLLARSGRTPVHASAVVIGGRALVLAGPSGSGKSTLALAAAKLGLPVLSDDTIYVQTAPRLGVWGMCGAVHVLPQDAPLATAGSRLRNGRLKLAVPLANTLRFAARASVVLLERGREVALVESSEAEALARLGRLEAGFDLLREESEAAHRALLRGGEAWKLTLSHDPAAAIELLCDRFAAPR